MASLRRRMSPGANDGVLMMTRGKRTAAVGLLLTIVLSALLWSLPPDDRSLVASSRAVIALGPCLALASAKGVIAAALFGCTVLAFGVLAAAVDAERTWRKAAGYILFVVIWCVLGITSVTPYV